MFTLAASADYAADRRSLLLERPRGYGNLLAKTKTPAASELLLLNTLKCVLFLGYSSWCHRDSANTAMSHWAKGTSSSSDRHQCTSIIYKYDQYFHAGRFVHCCLWQIILSIRLLISDRQTNPLTSCSLVDHLIYCICSDSSHRRCVVHNDDDFWPVHARAEQHLNLLTSKCFDFGFSTVCRSLVI